MSIVQRMAVLAVLLVANGCQLAWMGRLQDVQPVSDRQRVGNVYLVRGWIGVFSLGIDDLSSKIEKEGIRARAYQDVQASELADTLVKTYRGWREREPLVLVGHSYGADDVVMVADRLDRAGIPVDLLVTLDPVTPGHVPPNVVRACDFYQSNGVWDTLPWLRGVPLQQKVPGRGEVANVDIRRDRPGLLEPGTNHFTIDKNERVQAAVVEEILRVCVRREEWAAIRRGTPPGGDVETPLVPRAAAQSRGGRVAAQRTAAGPAGDAAANR